VGIVSLPKLKIGTSGLKALFLDDAHCSKLMLGRGSDAYSGEVDRPFRRNVTGDSAESALQLFSTRIGHIQSRLLDRLRHELRLCRGFRLGDELGCFPLAHRLLCGEMDAMRPVD
jgi:hypothetical protein